MSGQRQRIGVLIDGSSRHREASRESGEAIAAALAGLGHDARPVFVDQDLDLALRQGRFDLAFLALRGQQGSDGSVQGLLELLGIPYTGAGVLASALAMNQAKARELLRLANLPTAPGYLLRAGASRSVLEQHEGLGFPVAVGPADTGLTVGIAAGAASGAGRGTSVAHDELELEAAVEEAFRFGDEVLVERFHDGHVVAIAVLEGEALGAIDLGPRNRASSAPLYPAVGRSRVRTGRAAHPALLRLAEKSCVALDVEGPALVELVVNPRHNEVVRGVDVAPLLAPQSLFSRIAGAAGIGFAALVETVLDGARLRTRARLGGQRASAVPAVFGRELGSPRAARSSCALPH